MACTGYTTGQPTTTLRDMLTSSTEVLTHSLSPLSSVLLSAFTRFLGHGFLTLFSHCSEEERVSAYDIASKRSNWQRAGGWKLQHFALQLDEMVCSSMLLLTTCKFVTLLRLSFPLSSTPSSLSIPTPPPPSSSPPPPPPPFLSPYFPAFFVFSLPSLSLSSPLFPLPPIVQG